MQGVRWDNWIILVTIITIWFELQIVTSAQITTDEGRSSDEDSSSKIYSKKGAPNGLWFGPRLGKRTADLIMDPNLRRFLLEVAAYSGEAGPSDGGVFSDNLKNTFYTIADGKPVDGTAGSKRRFTPRLGRESGEQEITGNSRNVDFIPRLGRELMSNPWKYIYPESDYFLYGRSTDNENRPLIQQNRVPPFAPRLGRTLALMLQSEKQDNKDPIMRIARSADSDKNKERRCPKTSKPVKI